MTILGAIMYFISGCIILVLGICAVLLVIGITDPVKLDNMRQSLEKYVGHLQDKINGCKDELKSDKEDKGNEN